MSEELKLEACPWCSKPPSLGKELPHAFGSPSTGRYVGCHEHTKFMRPLIWNRRSPSPEFAALAEAVSELTKHARVEMIDGEPTVFVSGVLMCSPATSRVIYDLRAAAERALKGGGRG